MTPEEERALLVEAGIAIFREDPAAWLEGYGAVVPKGGGELRYPDLRCNVIQRRVNEVLAEARHLGRKARVIVVKPRQVFVSCFSMAAMHVYLKRRRMRGLVLGCFHEQGENLFAYLRTFNQTDGFERGKCGTVGDRKGSYPNGSSVGRQTVGNEQAGLGKTVEFLVVTEASRLEEVCDAADTMGNVLKCVPEEPNTVVIIESTARGVGTEFHRRVLEAVSLDEWRGGRDGYVLVFAGWWEFPEHRREPGLEGIRGEGDYSPQERELASRYRLDPAQVAWMRWAVREQCSGNFDKFREDYPFDVEDAFVSSGRAIFDGRRVRERAREAGAVVPALGVLEWQGLGEESLLWRGTGAEDCWMARWGEPEAGARYLVVVDTMTGEEQGPQNPDNHGVVALRAGDFGPRGWRPPDVVARLCGDWGLWERERRWECRWRMDVLEERAWRLAKYFGNCLIVVECNSSGLALIELLKKRPGVRLYRREILGRTDGGPTSAYGWQTTARTKEMIVSGAERRFAQPWEEGRGLGFVDPATLAEMLTFVRGKGGSAEAGGGAHDDGVMALMIGLQCEGGATAYDPRRVGAARVDDGYGAPGWGGEGRKMVW